MSETSYTTLIETEIFESLESLKNPIGTIPQDEVVTLIEPNLGKFFQISKIEYMVSQATSAAPAQFAEVFIRSCFLAPHSSNTSPPETFQIVGEEEEVSVPNPIKTKNAKLGMPYMEGNNVYVVLDSNFVDKQDLADNLADLKLTAISRMVEYYGRKATEIQLNEFIANPFGLIKVADQHFPTRPCKGIIIKFSVKKKYFDAFEKMSFDDFSIDNIHKNFIAISIKGKEFESTMSDLVKILDKYDTDIRSFSGSITGLDFAQSSADLRNFVSSFKKFLSNNNVSLENIGETKFEIGFNMETYRIEYVLHFDPYGNFLTTGIHDMSAEISTALSKILIGYKDILSASIGGMGWMDLCNNFLTGEFKIDFVSPAEKLSGAKAPKSQVEAELKKISADYDELVIMDSDKTNQLSNLKKDPAFKEKASELLLRSRDVVGDNFLINLPDILANVEDLSSLYGLVFDKVSIKDLVDLLMDKMTENLNLPDINEIKLRGVLKALTPEMSLGLLDEFVATAEELSKFNATICDALELTEGNIDDILKNFKSTQTPIQFYFIHYDGTGNLAGMLVDAYEGDLEAKLDENGINDCLTLLTAYKNNNFNISDYFQAAAVKQIMCEILTTGLPSIGNVCIDGSTSQTLSASDISNLKPDIMDMLKSIDTSVLVQGIDGFIKTMFENAKNYQKQLDLGANQSSYVTGLSAPDMTGIEFHITPGDLFDRFLKIPKLKLELDKLSLTKKKMLNKVPNVNLDLESKKKDVNFSLPSIKSVNPSFDFSSFEFTSMGDIFGGAVEGIENAIVDGIEKGLITAFKGILQNVLDSLNMDLPDIDSPDFGALNMNDLMDASNGTSANAIAGLILDDLNFEIGKFDPNFDTNAIDISGLAPSLDDIVGVFNDMSNTLKPLELTRVMKGQANKKDFENMTCAIQDPELKQAFTPSVFKKAMGTIADFVDIDMLEELESAYDNKEVMVSVCKNNGIPYCLRDIKDTLEEKYSSFTDEQICELIDDIVEGTKDSLVDAIGSLKDNFNDNLPYNEDPCSFMPKPSDIPGMDFVNNLAFDAIFNPIELEYKAEATSFPDLMLMTSGSEEYVKCRLFQYDSVPTEVFQDPATGLFDIEYDFVSSIIEDFDEELGIFNQDFSNHYFGDQTPVYYLGNDNKFYRADKDDFVLTKVNDEYIIEENKTNAIDRNLYVQKVKESLQPIPKLKDSYLNTNFLIHGYGGGAGYAQVDFANPVDEDDRTLGYLNYQRGYKISFNSLSSEESLVNFTQVNLEADDEAAMVELNVGGDPLLANRPPELIFDLGGTLDNPVTKTQMKYPTVEAVANPQCIDVDASTELSSDPPSTPSIYATAIENTIDYTCHDILESLGFESTLGSYRRFFGFHTDGYDQISQDMPGDMREGKDLVGNMTADMVQLMMRSLGESKLFETNEMLAFLFETEDVNLFRLQEAKNAAKDDYNENCGFTDDNKSMLKEATSKQLVYLTLRIYTIDIIMKSCFVNSVLYEEEISDYLLTFIYDYMIQELSMAEESYYSTFKNMYSEAYGEDFESESSAGPPPKFKETVTEIYADMASFFEIIFPDAAMGTVGAALSKIKIFTGDDPEFIRELYDAYMYGRNLPNEYSKFFIQILFVDKDGVEQFWTKSSQGTRPFDAPLKVRLCYIIDEWENCTEYLQEVSLQDNGMGWEVTANWSPHQLEHRYRSSLHPDGTNSYGGGDFLDYSAVGSEGIYQGDADPPIEVILGDWKENYRDPGSKSYLPAKVNKFNYTVSFNMHYGSAGWPTSGTEPKSPRLIVLPIAETKIDMSSDSTQDLQSQGYKLFINQMDNDIWEIDGVPYERARGLPLSIIKHLTANEDNRVEYSIYDFFKNKLRSDSYIDLVRRTLLIKLQQLKPEVIAAFSDTKAAIRRAGTSISKEKEVYDYIELETDTVQKEQSQGVGTSPDFSPKAKKMALMTVPLIVKGMAEMFDPNTKLASLIRKTANMSGLDIPPTIASLMALPFNVIPLAPGPPITPLGLTYLATSFLEPKERKRLSDLKRGKNINPGADPETGGFVGGSPEELLEAREERAREAYALAQQTHMKLLSFCKTWSGEYSNAIWNIYNDYLDDDQEHIRAYDIPNYFSENMDRLGETMYRESVGSNDFYSGVVALMWYSVQGDATSEEWNTSFKRHAESLGDWISPRRWWTREDDAVEMSQREYDIAEEEKEISDFLYKVKHLMFNHLNGDKNRICEFPLSRKSSGGTVYTTNYNFNNITLAQQVYAWLHYMDGMDNTGSYYTTESFLSESKFAPIRNWMRATLKLVHVSNRAIAFLAYGMAKIMNDAGIPFEIDFTNDVVTKWFKEDMGYGRFDPSDARYRLSDTMDTGTSDPPQRLVLTPDNIDMDFRFHNNVTYQKENDNMAYYYRNFYADELTDESLEGTGLSILAAPMDRLFDRWLNDAGWYQTNAILGSDTYNQLDKEDEDGNPIPGSEAGARTTLRSTVDSLRFHSQIFLMNNGANTHDGTGPAGSPSPKGVGIYKFFEMMEQSSLFDQLVALYMENAEAQGDAWRDPTLDSRESYAQGYDGDMGAAANVSNNAASVINNEDD